MTHWWQEEYPVAPHEFQLEQARAMVARLGGALLTDLPDAGQGCCDDCDQDADLFLYGKFIVCRCCASTRQRAGATAA